MSNSILPPILELHLTGLPTIFDSCDLEKAAQHLLDDFCTLLQIDVLLQHTVVTHGFRLTVDSHERPAVLIVIGLRLQNQQLLNFASGEQTLGALELSLLEDRDRLVTACQNLPAQTTLVTMDLAQRVSAASLNLPADAQDPELAHHLTVLLGVKARQWHGSVTDHPFQLAFPALPRYEWQVEWFDVRVKLEREKQGFSLTLLRPNDLAPALQSTTKLRMPERPASIELASLLDRAEHTGAPVNMVIRAGNRPGSTHLIVADFVGFRRPFI